MKDLKQKLITLVEKCIDNENYKMVPMVINKIAKEPDVEQPGTYYYSAISEKFEGNIIEKFERVNPINFIGGIKFIGEDVIKYLQVVKVQISYKRVFTNIKTKSTKFFLNKRISFPVIKTESDKDAVIKMVDQYILGNNTSYLDYEIYDTHMILTKTLYVIQTVVNEKILLAEITKDEYDSFIKRKKNIVDSELNVTLDDIIEKVS